MDRKEPVWILLNWKVQFLSQNKIFKKTPLNLVGILRFCHNIWIFHLGTLNMFSRNVNPQPQEFAKFMQDVLDALFNILMINENEAYDNQVFKTLVETILLITDDKSEYLNIAILHI